MNIFYAASVGSSDETDKYISKVIPKLLSEGGNWVYTSIYNPDQGDAEAIESIAEHIVAADVFIGEMSRPSQTLGFELAYALNNTKPSLYLYYEGKRAQPGTMLLHNPSRLLKIQSYTGENLPKILTSFLRSAETQLNSARTSFMSTRKIDDFLSAESHRRGISKGELIREVLTRHIEQTK